MCVNEIQIYACGHASRMMQKCPTTTANPAWPECAQPAFNTDRVTYDCERCATKTATNGPQSSSVEAATIDISPAEICSIEARLNGAIESSEMAADVNQIPSMNATPTETLPSTTTIYASSSPQPQQLPQQTRKRIMIPQIALQSIKQAPTYNNHATIYLCGHFHILENKDLPRDAHLRHSDFPYHKFGTENVKSFCNQCHRAIWVLCTGEIEKQHKLVHERGECECGDSFTEEEKAAARETVTRGQVFRGPSNPAIGYSSNEIANRLTRMYETAKALWCNQWEIKGEAVEQCLRFVDDQIKEERRQEQAECASIIQIEPFHEQIRHAEDLQRGLIEDNSLSRMNSRRSARCNLAPPPQPHFQPLPNGMIRTIVCFDSYPVTSSQISSFDSCHPQQVSGTYYQNICPSRPNGYRAYQSNNQIWATSAENAGRYHGADYSPTPRPRRGSNHQFHRYQNIGSYERHDANRDRYTRKHYAPTLYRNSGAHQIDHPNFENYTFPRSRDEERRSSAQGLMTSMHATEKIAMPPTPRTARRSNSSIIIDDINYGSSSSISSFTTIRRTISAVALDSAETSRQQTPTLQSRRKSLCEVIPPLSAACDALATAIASI